MAQDDGKDEDADSEDEPFSEEDKSPAGDRVEKVLAPASIREIYCFLELLHDSGVGRRVYLCEQGQPERRVSRGGDAGERQQKRCVLKAWAKSAWLPEETEAWLQTQLLLLRMERHPNVVQPRRILEDERCYYIELDAVLVGCSLFQVILNDASSTERQLRRIVREILRGLGHLHSHGLSHGDVRPENVLLEWQGADGLMNKGSKLPNAWPSSKRGVSRWGAAAHFKSAWCRHDLVSRVRIVDLDSVGTGDSRHACGTPGYMAPEAYTRAAGPRGDLFGVGVIVHLLIGCDAPLHDAVFAVLGDLPLREADASTRKQIAAEVKKCLRGLDWSEAPWDKLELASKLCRTLLSVEPAERGHDASSILKHGWFSKDALAIGADAYDAEGEAQKHLDDLIAATEDWGELPDRQQMRQNVVVQSQIGPLVPDEPNRPGSLAGAHARRSKRGTVVGPAVGHPGSDGTTGDIDAASRTGSASAARGRASMAAGVGRTRSVVVQDGPPET